MSVLVGFHLRKTQYCILALPAVVMGLFAIVTAALMRTMLGWSELLKPCSHDGVKLLVLSTMCNNLVRISTVVVALKTVEVAAAFLICTWQIPTCVMQNIQFAFISMAGDSTESVKLISTQSVQSLMSSSVLDEPGFVTKPIVAILPHAVEMGLVLSVVTITELTILVEPKSHVSFRNRLVL